MTEQTQANPSQDKKFEAEALLALQQTDTEKLITAREGIALKKAQLDYAEYNDLVTRLKHANIRNRRYDFAQMVNKESVDEATGILSSWARESDAPITIALTSPGGDIFVGLALFDAIRSFVEHGVPITTIAYGITASMATAILQAGSRRVVTPNSWFMIHEGEFEQSGKVSEQEEAAAFFRRIQSQYVEILAERSTLTKQEIQKRSKKKEWWMNAKEVLKYGFADEVGYK